MLLRRSALLATAVALLLTLSAAGGALAQGTAQGTNAATAELVDNEGERVGTAEFVEEPEGVEITAQVQGLPAGEKGIHIHETGDISSSDFESAGDHFNPTDAQHGLSNSEGPHAGDLENIVVDEDGSASYSTFSDRITLSEGERSIFDEDGSAIVIHSEADDQQTDPTGESGDRIAAGTIEPVADEELPETGGFPLAPVAVSLALAGAGLLLLRRLVTS